MVSEPQTNWRLSDTWSRETVILLLTPTDEPGVISSAGGWRLSICVRATFGDLLEIHEKFRVVPSHMADAPCIIDEPPDVACCENKIEMAFAVSFLQQPELAVELLRFLFHQRNLVVGQPADLLRVGRIEELRRRRRADKGPGARDRILVHRHHELGGLDLLCHRYIFRYAPCHSQITTTELNPSC